MDSVTHTKSYRNVHPLALLHQHHPEAKRPVPVAPTLAEAPCSVNMFFEVEGVGKAQATGRGFTPAEAAANLIGTIESVRTALLPPPIPALKTRTEQLATLLACWLGKAVERADFGLCERLGKGATLVLAGMVEGNNREGLVAVRSQANPMAWYEVEANTCTCKDYEVHARKGAPEHACKHRIAAAIWQRLTD